MARCHPRTSRTRYILLGVGIVVVGLLMFLSLYSHARCTNILLRGGVYVVDCGTRDVVANVSTLGRTNGNAIPGLRVFSADAVAITDPRLLSQSCTQSDFEGTNTWLDLAKTPGVIANAWQLSTNLCSGSVVIFWDYAVLFNQAILDPTLVQSRGMTGGETLREVVEGGGANQKKELEFFTWKPGFLTVNCSDGCEVNALTLRKEGIWKDGDKPEFFMNDNYAIPFLNVASEENKLKGLTVGIIRYEYANWYWTLMDLYNVYLVSRLLETDASLTKVLIMDIHPRGSLDGFWATLYHEIILLGQLKEPISPDSLVLIGKKGRDILINNNPPLFSDFRKFAYEQHGWEYREKVKPDLSKCPLLVGFNILVIMRRNYVAHVRNPSGNVDRKFLNEVELMTGLHIAFPNATISDVQLDLLNTSAQLASIAKADIVLGMHGAGLAYGGLQRRGTGMIEIFLKKYATAKNPHMETLARQNGVHYLSWTNGDSKLERKDSLDIPVDVVLTLFRAMRDKLCGITHPG